MSEHGNEGTMPMRDETIELTADEAALAARLGAELRTVPALRREFDEHVMRAVAATATDAPPFRAEQAPREWWSRPTALRLSPLRGLAIAAGFAGFVVLGTLGATGQLRPNQSRAITADAGRPMHTDTVHLVRFVLSAPEASRVALVGDFNGWSPEATALAPSAVDGLWAVLVSLPAGRQEYAFIVDGERWVADPLAPSVADEFGGAQSVLRLGDFHGTM